MVNIVDPDVIVIGGGVGNIECLYTQGEEQLKKHVFNPYFEAKIVPPKLGDSAGVFGRTVGLDLIDLPVVSGAYLNGLIIGGRFLVAYKRRWIGSAEVHIVCGGSFARCPANSGTQEHT